MFLSRGKPQPAEKECRKALQYDSMNEVAHDELLKILFIQRKYREGVKVAREGVRRLPDSTIIKAWLGMHLYKRNRFKSAHDHLRGATTAHPQRFLIQAVAGQCCLRMEDHKNAIKALRNYLVHRPSRLAKRDHTFRVLLATSYLKTGKLGEAEELLKKVLGSIPGNIPAEIVLAEVRLKKKDCSQAVAGYVKLFRKLSTDKKDELRLNLGQGYLCIRRYKRAMEQAKMYVKRYPKNAGGLLLLGDSLLKLKRTRRALHYYKRLDGLTKGSRTDVKLRIAEVFYKERRYRKVLDQLSGELKKKTADLNTLVLLLRAAIRLKKIPLALRCAKALMARPVRPAAAYHYAGMAHNSAGKFQKAIPLHKKALAMDPKHRGIQRELVKALSYLARAAMRRRDYDEAIRQLKQAHSIDPGLIVNRNLALAYLGADRHDKAMVYIRVILKKVPRDFIANRLAARILVRMKKYAKAARHAREAESIILKHGGMALARALAESAVIHLHAGMNEDKLINRSQVEQSAIKLERALVLVNQVGGDKALVASIKGNLARAYLAKAQISMKRGQAKVAWTEIQRAVEEGSALPKEEKSIITASAALAALYAGKIAEGKALIRKVRGSLSKIIVPPYNKVAAELLLVYADYLGRSLKDNLRASLQLEKLAKKLPQPAGGKLTALAGSSYEQAAVMLYRYGKNKRARRAFKKAIRLQRHQSPRLRHNLAVLDFYEGKIRSSVALLDAVKGKVPSALCNLAVYHDRSGGESRKVLELLRRCKKKGVPFPRLESLIRSKKRVLGE